MNPCRMQKTSNLIFLPVFLALTSISLLMDSNSRLAITRALYDVDSAAATVSLSPNYIALIAVALAASLLVFRLGTRWASQNKATVVKALALAVIVILAFQPILFSSAVQLRDRDENSLGIQQPVAERSQQIKGVFKGTECIACHKSITPGIVADWEMSRHAKPSDTTKQLVNCDSCHGQNHEKLIMPNEMPCKSCHPQKVEEFTKGKHHLAWVAMDVVTRGVLNLPEHVVLKACGACHRIGYSGNTTEWSINAPGVATTPGAKCDSCHTRHRFDVAESRKPEACYTCHMGFDHPQYEMFLSSRHGLKYTHEGSSWNFSYPRNTEWPYNSPVCITCHMGGGTHAVKTPWGYLSIVGPGVGPPANDTKWWNDNAEILKGLGVLTPEGKEGPVLSVAKEFEVARLSPQEFQTLREGYMATCRRCHSPRFVESNFKNYEAVIKESTGIMAEAIREVAQLYKEGYIKKQGNYPFEYPFLLTFYNASTPVEQTLWVMFFEHRNRAIMGSFHQNPDYMHWEGYGPMRESLVRIRAEADVMRTRGPVKPVEKGLSIPEIAAAAATVMAVAAIVVAARSGRKAKATS